MNRNFSLVMILCFTLYTTTVMAQVSTTPEIPRNYKPQSKELLPMPGTLTDEVIFPALGRYAYTDKEGNAFNVAVSRDSDSKGIIWISGMPHGKFKADLKASPATYKIPVQKTLQNDVDTSFDAAAAGVGDVSDTTIKSQSVPGRSGTSLKEGTVIFDSTSQKLYVHTGTPFREADPASVFPEIMMADSAAADTSVTVSSEGAAGKRSNASAYKKKRSGSKGTTYVLTKIVEDGTTSAEEDEKSDETTP